MADLPIMLRLDGRLVLIVGGGEVALRRAKAMVDCGAQVRLVAPQVIEELNHVPRVQITRRGYDAADLDHVSLVVVATDDPQLNERVADEARQRGILVNRTDNAALSDFIVPAHRRTGPITLAVSTEGISALAAATIRDQLLDQLDPMWIKLLETMAPFRDQLRRQVAHAPQRHAAIRRMTNDQALGRFKADGPEAFADYCRQVLADAVNASQDDEQSTASTQAPANSQRVNHA